MTRAELMPKIMMLSLEDRLWIAEELFRSAPAAERPDEAEFRRELDRRLAEADAHPETMVPWDEALRQLRNKRHVRN